MQASLHWPLESSFQGPVLDIDWLGRAADIYYIVMHVSVFMITLAWVLFLRRPDWPFVRTTVVILTGACLLLQYKPVAPPRLIPELGVVDTAAVHNLSVYGAIPGANQFAAMPSVHVAWAAAVALIIIVVARTRWRWLALAYPIATSWV
ncbi:MAG: phosphatase PAP2 family protein, partial [bacterium]|nr:phosphatase PAP2 family protein [bacterium]